MRERHQPPPLLFGHRVQICWDVPNASLIPSARHVEALRAAHEGLERAAGAARADLPLEFIAADVREGADALSSIVGEISSDDVLNNIFGSFCVGK